MSAQGEKFQHKKENNNVYLRILDENINPHIILHSLRETGTALSLQQVESAFNSEGEWIKITQNEGPSVEVRITTDRMKGELRLKTTSNSPLPGLDVIRKSLREEGILEGIDEKVLGSIHENKEFLRGDWIVMASGTMPEKPVDAVLEIAVEVDRTGPDNSKNKSLVDLKDLGLVHNVKEGQVIVKKNPPVEGINGCDVSGKVLKAGKARDIRIKSGANTSLSEDGLELVSLANGHLVRDGNTFRVEKVFEVSGDVDYGTGNLESFGSIKVLGSIQNDFSVTAHESLEVTGVIEAAYVRSGRDMILKSGVRGMGKGTICCGHDLAAEYIDQCRVDVENDIIFRNALMHCQVDAEGSIKSREGGKGIIAGGTLKAGRDIECSVLGTRMGTKTYIAAGSSPRQIERSGELRNIMEDLKEKEETVEKNLLYLSKVASERGLNLKQKDTAEKCLRLRSMLKEKIEVVTGQIEKIRENEASVNRKCEVRIKGICYPGVSVSIGKDTLIVKDSIEEVRFISEDGSVKAVPLEEE